MQERDGDKRPDAKEHFDAKNTYNSTEVDDDIVESDIELDVTDVVEPDDDTPQKVGGIKLGADVSSFFFFSGYVLSL